MALHSQSESDLFSSFACALLCHVSQACSSLNTSSLSQGLCLCSHHSFYWECSLWSWKLQLLLRGWLTCPLSGHLSQEEFVTLPPLSRAPATWIYCSNFVVFPTIYIFHYFIPGHFISIMSSIFFYYICSVCWEKQLLPFTIWVPWTLYFSVIQWIYSFLYHLFSYSHLYR